MKKETKMKLIKFLYILIIVLFVAYIFSNSIESREASSSKSTKIVEKVNITLKKINSPILLEEVFLRKSAHFIEFFVLGTLLSGYLCLNKTVNYTTSIYSCFIACITAMTDETIQYFSGRGSMLLDVWLDFSAASLAVILVYLIYIRYQKKRQKQ